MNEQTMWGMHAGRTGDADRLFLKENRVAVGWDKVGDLSKLDATRNAFKAAIAQAYPDKLPGAIPVDGGQLFRFIHEMNVGDVVVYSSKKDRQVHIGKVEGSYEYDPSLEEGYPHSRSVRWLKSVPRTSFKQGALHEVGAGMSLFQVKNYAEDFYAALSGDINPLPVDEDETVAPVAEDIEQTTQDFVLKALAGELKGHPFTYLVAQLLGTMGYRSRVSPEGPDGGIDIIAHRDELGFEPPIIKIQVKSTEGNVGLPVVSALYGNVGSNEHGLVVTLGGFTPPAINFARSNTNLRLVDGEELVDLILSHYDDLDPRYKGIIPLKRVYVPEPATD